MSRGKTTVLTEKQKEVLEALTAYIDENKYPPTYQELANILKIRYSSIGDRMAGLVRKGYIERSRNARSIRILRRLDGHPRSRLVAIPLVGTVVAGIPVLAEENRQGEILLETSIEDPENCFAVKAQGDSMIEAGIKTGDVLKQGLSILCATGLWATCDDFVRRRTSRSGKRQRVFGQ